MLFLCYRFLHSYCNFSDICDVYALRSYVFLLFFVLALTLLCWRYLTCLCVMCSYACYVVYVLFCLHSHCYLGDRCYVYALCVRTFFLCCCCVVVLHSHCYFAIFALFMRCVFICFYVVFVVFCTHIAILAIFTVFMHFVFLSFFMLFVLFFARTLLFW